MVGDLHPGFELMAFGSIRAVSVLYGKNPAVEGRLSEEHLQREVSLGKSIPRICLTSTMEMDFRLL